MNPSERENAILRLMAHSSEVSVSQLSTSLGVSQVTVRADLNSLDSKGLIVRTRGGAKSAIHPAIKEHQDSNTQIKEAIAEKAASLVHDGDSVMVCNGTTSALVARHLLGKKDVRVVTNSTLILPYARVNSGLDVTLIGGEFRPETEGMVGPAAERQLRDYHVSIAFLGTDGITLEHGMTTALAENAEIIRTMCSQADKTVLVADSSKFGRKGFVRIVPADGIDVLITDSRFPEEAAKAFRKMGVEVIIV